MIEKFITDTGIEIPAITTEQMRQVDRIAIKETGPNLYQMMENAGRNLALQAIEMLGENWFKAGIIVLAGSGGNGGGGICAARHLANRNANVRLCMTNPDRLGEVPGQQLKIYRSTSGRQVGFSSLDAEPVDLIIDALIGYSLQAAPTGVALKLIGWANSKQSLKLSLDVPSGIDSTTGEAAGDYFRTNVTMTLALPKTGLLPSKTGELILADIGIPATIFKKLKLEYVSPFDQRYRVNIQQITHSGGFNLKVNV